MAIRTIFRMAEDCASGQRQGWEEFVRDYAGITRALLTHYFPTLTPDDVGAAAGQDQDCHWGAVDPSGI